MTPPAAAPPPAAPAGVPPLGPAGVLEVSAFTVIASRAGPRFVYEAQLIITETSGRGGAMIDGLKLTPSTGDSDTACLGGSDLRVPPGGRWNISLLGYCAPTPGSAILADLVTVDIDIVYDDRTRGTMRAVAPVPR